uniref:leucine zipper protein 2-like n=1 Tax=Pristiophorus japonicus TaxID=55135 RepID=UPI00398EAD14
MMKLWGYEDLETKLKQISMEKSSLLQQLSKSATEVKGMNGNLQSSKTDEAVAKNDVQKLLEISQKQKDEMKSLQETLQKQINEAALKAEKQQAGINFLKAEVERKSKLIKDLQQENKSLKNKLLSGNKQCGIRAEESKRIQSQLKELRYGKKDLIFKAQQLSDLEHKLLAAKQELEKQAGDKESQLKALKEVAQLCVSGVLRSQPPFMSIISPRTMDSGMPLAKDSSRLPINQTNRKLSDISQAENISSPSKGAFLNESVKNNDHDLMDCGSHNWLQHGCWKTAECSCRKLQMALQDVFDQFWSRKAQLFTAPPQLGRQSLGWLDDRQRQRQRQIGSGGSRNAVILREDSRFLHH